jgi:hypothetical protein
VAGLRGQGRRRALGTFEVYAPHFRHHTKPREASSWCDAWHCCAVSPLQGFSRNDLNDEAVAATSLQREHLKPSSLPRLSSRCGPACGITPLPALRRLAPFFVASGYFPMAHVAAKAVLAITWAVASAASRSSLQSLSVMNFLSKLLAA